MKKLTALVGSLALVGAISAHAADAAATPATPYKVAIVNVQQVLQQSPRVADLSKKLQDQFKSRQQKLDGEQKKLADELDKFKNDAPSMSQKDRDATQKKLTDERSELVKQVVAFQQDVNKEQTKVMQGIIAQLNEVISGLAKKGNFNLVLDSQAVVFAADGTDLTKQVAKDFEKK